MTRLTKDIRERMAKILLKKRFFEEGEALVARSLQLFYDVYEHLYDQETRTLMTKLIKRAPDAFDYQRSLEVNAGGYRVIVGMRRIGSETYWAVSEPKMLPILKNHRGCGTISLGSTSIADIVKSFAVDAEAFKTAIQRANSELISAMGLLTTAKQLSERWPEALPLVGHLIPHDKPGLPAIRFDNLNAAYGLAPLATEQEATA